METQRPPSIAKIATKYGLIDGVLAFVIFLVVAMTSARQGWASSIASLVALVVLMVLAHREFKKSHEGIMSYGQGLGLGTLLAVIATAFTCVLLYIYVTFINTGYPAAALAAQKAVLEQRGIEGPQLEQAMSLTGAMLTPVGMVVSGLISGVIFGFIVALIVSIFTKEADPRAVI